MSTSHVEIQLSTEELLRAIGRLPLAELDQLTEQILMLRAERRATKRQPKYAPLKEWLIKQAGETVITVSFRDIEREIDDTLPAAAREHRAWWANDQRHVEAQAWMEAGWKTEDVDIAAERVTFRRIISAARNARS